jgi:hypothetical protein
MAMPHQVQQIEDHKVGKSDFYIKTDRLWRVLSIPWKTGEQATITVHPDNAKQLPFPVAPFIDVTRDDRYPIISREDLELIVYNAMQLVPKIQAMGKKPFDHI